MSKQIADIVFFKAQAQYTTPYLPVNDKILAGHPEQQIENVYSDPGDQFHCGRWRSDIGNWKVSYTEHEYCCILKGKSRLTDLEGNVVELTAGDHFVIPAGFEGSWEVLEPCEKIYVIYEPV